MLPADTLFAPCMAVMAVGTEMVKLAVMRVPCTVRDWSGLHPFLLKESGTGRRPAPGSGSNYSASRTGV